MARTKNRKNHHCSICGSANKQRCIAQKHLAKCESNDCPGDRYFSTLHGCSIHPYSAGWNTNHRWNGAIQPIVENNDNQATERVAFVDDPRIAAAANVLQGIAKETNEKRVAQHAYEFKKAYPDQAYALEQVIDQVHKPDEIKTRNGRSRTTLIGQNRVTNEQRLEASPKGVRARLEFFGRAISDRLGRRRD